MKIAAFFRHLLSSISLLLPYALRVLQELKPESVAAFKGAAQAVP